MSHAPELSPVAGRVRRAVPRLALAGLVFVAIALAAGAVARVALQRSNPAPGAFVSVNGRRVHVNCQGTGDTTVVLEAGLMDFSILWAEVQPLIKSFTRVCSYDRAGLGWSQANRAPRSAAVSTRELKHILDAAGIAPPYVMVGHSYGGLIVRRFAREHRGDVVGLVLLDAAHVDQLRRLPALEIARDETRRQFRSLRIMSSLGLLALMPSTIPARGLTATHARQYRAVLASSGYFASALAELGAMEESIALEPGDSNPLADLPVVVVSRGRPEPLPSLDTLENRRLEQQWHVLQRDLLALSSRSTHLTAEGSGHDVHVQQPGIVVIAIRSVLSAARSDSRAPLTDRSRNGGRARGIP